MRRSSRCSTRSCSGRFPSVNPRRWSTFPRRDRSRRVRCRLQLSDVPRPAARAEGLHRNRGAPRVQRQPRLRRPDAERRGVAGIRQLFSAAWTAAGGRPSADPGRRQGAWGVAGGGAEPRILVDALRRGSRRRQQDDDRQWPVADDRRRGAARIRRHDARRSAQGVCADHASRPDGAAGSTSSRGCGPAFRSTRHEPGSTFRTRTSSLRSRCRCSAA